MKKWWLLVFGVFAYVITIGLYFTNRTMYMKKKDEKLIRDREIKAKRFVVEEFKSLPKTEILVDSPFGYKLHCLFVHPHTTKKWIIISHGITENKINSIKYMNIFLKRGFNAVIYDHRRHGESGGLTSSFGHYEKFDLKAVIDELKKREGEDITLGIHGESMGAVTTLLYAGMLEDGADFYIVDCPFSDFTEQLKHNLKAEVPLPSWAVLPIGNAFMKLRNQYSFKDVSPIQYVGNIQKPVLFIHSKLDTFILPKMTVDLFEAKKGPKKLFVAEKGAHAQSFNENPKEYEETIDEFLQEFVFPH